MSPNNHLAFASSGALAFTLRHKSSTKSFISKAKNVRWLRKSRRNPLKAAMNSLFRKPSLDLHCSGDPDVQPVLDIHNSIARPLSPVLEAPLAASDEVAVQPEDIIDGDDISLISATGIASTSATDLASTSATTISSPSAQEIDPEDYRIPRRHRHYPTALSPILEASPAVSDEGSEWWDDTVVGIDISSISATGITSMSATGLGLGIAFTSATGLSSLSTIEISPLPSSAEFPSSDSPLLTAEDLPWIQLLTKGGVLAFGQQSAEPTTSPPAESTPPTPTAPHLAPSPFPVTPFSTSLLPTSPLLPISPFHVSPLPHRSRHSMIINSPTSPVGEDLDTSIALARTIHSAFDDVATYQRLISGGMPYGDSLVFLYPI